MSKAPNIALTPFQQQVALGTLLGDSSLSCPRNGRNYHLSCYHAIAQREWLTQKHTWLAPASRPIQWCAYLDKRDGKTRQGGRFHTVSIPCFTRLAAMMYDPARRKVIREELLSLITEPVALACLICDDGSWDGAGIGIASKQFTAEENERLAGFLAARFGLGCRALTKEKYPHVRIGAASVEKARQLCLPFVPAPLRYKFGPPGYTTSLVGRTEKPCGRCKAPFLSYESEAKKYCSRQCAAAGRPSGYVTRTATATCERCGQPFLVYVKRQKRCPACRKLPPTGVCCPVCGSAIKRAGRKTCSTRCGGIWGHKSRQG